MGSFSHIICVKFAEVRLMSFHSDFNSVKTTVLSHSDFLSIILLLFDGTGQAGIFWQSWIDSLSVTYTWVIASCLCIGIDSWKLLPICINSSTIHVQKCSARKKYLDMNIFDSTECLCTVVEKHGFKCIVSEAGLDFSLPPSLPSFLLFVMLRYLSHF